MSSATRTASPDHGEPSPSRGANVTRIASAAVSHGKMMAGPSSGLHRRLRPPMLPAAIDWTKWSAIGSLAAAAATMLVAAVTLWLVTATRGMVTAAKKGLDDDWAREWAAQRPVVYPLASTEWAQGHIPRKTVFPLRASN
jgi:hypothetical protein